MGGAFILVTVLPVRVIVAIPADGPWLRQSLFRALDPV